jgi:hypothetical protein
MDETRVRYAHESPENAGPVASIDAGYNSSLY